MGQAVHDGLIENWNVEDFFNIVSDADLLKLEFRRSNGKNLKAAGVYSDLVDCIINELLTAMRKKLASGRLPQQYTMFADRCLTTDSTIITFNWDHIVEWLIYRKFGCLNYCLDNTRRVDKSIGDFSSGVKLLKLHGSVNWLYCDNSKHPIRIYNTWKAQENKQEVCGKCNRQLSKMIVPPVWHKRPFAQRIGELWEIAADELCVADRIVIIGYSLPDGDLSAKNLFKLTNYLDRKARRYSVDIVNGPDFDDKLYRQVFSRSQKVENHKLFFKDYIAMLEAQ